MFSRGSISKPNHGTIFKIVFFAILASFFFFNQPALAKGTLSSQANSYLITIQEGLEKGATTLFKGVQTIGQVGDYIMAGTGKAFKESFTTVSKDISKLSRGDGRASSLGLAGLIEGIKGIGQEIKNIGSAFKSKVSELGQFLSQPFKEKVVIVEKEIDLKDLKAEMTKLAKEMETLKTEGLITKEVIKETKVSEITKIEPVKEITKETITIDTRALSEFKADLSDLDTKVSSLSRRTTGTIFSPPSHGLAVVGGDLSINGTPINTVISTAITASSLPIPANSVQGDILYRNATTWTRLVAGAAGQFLQTGGAGADPAWAAAAPAAGWTDDGATVRLTTIGDTVGIGTVGPNAKLEVLHNAEQLRLSFDAGNRMTTTVGAAGGVVFDAVGAGAGFTFQDSVTIPPASLIFNTANTITISANNPGAARIYTIPDFGLDDTFTGQAAAQALTNKTQYNGLIITPNTGVITTGTWNATAIGLQYGGTGANLAATGGANQFVKQSGAGLAFTVGAIADADVPDSITLTNITQITNRAITDTTGTLTVTRGGTGLNTIAQGGILYTTGLDTLSRIAPTGANQVLRSTGANALEIAALVAADIPNLDVSKITTGTLGLARGGTGADLSATGGANQFVKQSGAGAVFTVGAIADADVPDSITLTNITQITNRAITDTTGTLTVTRGGTGLATIAQGGILYSSALDTLSRLAPAGANLVLRSTGANALEIAALVAADIPNLDVSKITTGTLGLARGGTGADLSATGGANQFVKQSGAGAVFTVGAIADADVPDTITASNYLLLAGGTMAGNIDLNTNLLLNIGNAGTDFTAGGGLNIATDLDVAGHLAVGAGAVISSTAGINLDVNIPATAFGYGQYIAARATGAVSVLYGLSVWAGVAGGSVTNNYGLYIDDITSGTNDYGIAIAGADTQALWISSAENNTDAANGIAFGSSRDTNLYRLTAAVLQTDDTFRALGTGISANSYYELDGFSTANSERLCWDASGGSYITDCTGSPGDYAEYYGSIDASLEPGDVVSVAPPPEFRVAEGKSWVEKSSVNYDPNVLGIISTFPNETIGQLFSPEDNPKPVSLSGRAPIKVNLENGPIEIGDPLTSSSIPGVAMSACAKASADKKAICRSGPIIAKALEPYYGSRQLSPGVIRTEQDLYDETSRANPLPPGEIPDPDEEERAGIRIPPPQEGVGKIMAFVSVGYYLDPSDLNLESGAIYQEMEYGFSIPSFSDLLALIGGTIKNGILKLAHLIVGTLEVENGIQLKDRATGEVYCTWIENGEWQKARGECNSGDTSQVPSNNPAPPPPEPEEEPITEEPKSEEPPVEKPTEEPTEEPSPPKEQVPPSEEPLTVEPELPAEQPSSVESPVIEKASVELPVEEQ